MLIKTEYLTIMTNGISLPHLPEEQTDAQLLQRIKQKDRRALEAFYTHFQRPLFSYLLRLLGQETLAEDLLQEVMIIVWQQAQRYKGKATVSCWLFGIAHHQAYKILRKKTHEISLEADLNTLDRVQNLPDDELTPEDNALRSATSAEINQALNRLSAEHREVLELAFYQEFSCKEISSIVGIPDGTVKSRLSYARRALKAALLHNGWEG